MKNPSKIPVRLLVCSVALFALADTFAGTTVAQFKILDSDNDGRVSRAEYTAGATLMFDRLDANSDGVLTGEEMEAFHQKQSANKPADKKDEKSANEKTAKEENADGRLTRAENEAAADKMFSQLDTDRDGYLSRAECEACLTAALKK